MRKDDWFVLSIVTPTRNSSRFLDTTIASVVEQEVGERPLKILYHIQDCHSTDNTLDIVRSWQQRLTKPVNSRRKVVVLTASTESDTGMYDAINKGFSGLPITSSDLMTWINSDDVFAPGAFSSAASIVAEFDDVEWLGGRTAIMDEYGAITSIYKASPFRAELLRSGKYDGRNGRPFLMQEGTFWRPRIWSLVGGLDPTFRLAGDWDLWRRFSEHADYTAVDSVFGFHRKRAGQLSEDLLAYHAEIDAKLNREPPAIICRRSPAALIGYDYEMKRWARAVPKSEGTAKKGYLRSTLLGRLLSKLNRRRLDRRRARRESPEPSVVPPI